MAGLRVNPIVKILAWPESVAPASTTLKLLTSTTALESPFGRYLQTQELPGGRWMLEANFENLSAEQAGVLRAFRAKLRGAAGVFYFKTDASTRAALKEQVFAEDGTMAYAGRTGWPRTLGAQAPGPLLHTTAWPAGPGELAAQAGDYVSYDGYDGYRHLHIVTEDAFVAEDLTCALPVEPPVRAQPPSASDLMIDCPSCTFRMTDDSQLQIMQSGIDTFSAQLSAVQAFSPAVNFALDPLPKKDRALTGGAALVLTQQESVHARDSSNAQVVMVLTNTSLVTAYTVRATRTTKFSGLIASTSTGNLGAGQSCTFTYVRDTPQGAGTLTDYITVTAENADAVQAQMTVTYSELAGEDVSESRVYFAMYEDNTPGTFRESKYEYTDTSVSGTADAQRNTHFAHALPNFRSSLARAYIANNPSPYGSPAISDEYWHKRLSASLILGNAGTQVAYIESVTAVNCVATIFQTTLHIEGAEFALPQAAVPAFSIEPGHLARLNIRTTDALQTNRTTDVASVVVRTTDGKVLTVDVSYVLFNPAVFEPRRMIYVKTTPVGSTRSWDGFITKQRLENLFPYFELQESDTMPESGVFGTTHEMVGGTVLSGHIAHRNVLTPARRDNFSNQTVYLVPERRQALMKRFLFTPAGEGMYNEIFTTQTNQKPVAYEIFAKGALGWPRLTGDSLGSYYEYERLLADGDYPDVDLDESTSSPSPVEVTTAGVDEILTVYIKNVGTGPLTLDSLYTDSQTITPGVPPVSYSFCRVRAVNTFPIFIAEGDTLALQLLVRLTVPRKGGGTRVHIKHTGGEGTYSFDVSAKYPDNSGPIGDS